MTFKVRDHYFKKAKKENFLARSVYKLEEIDKKFKLINKNDLVLDLGYHPGSWVQYVSSKLSHDGKIIGIDIKPINEKLAKLPHVTLFQKDVNDVKELSDLNIADKFDLVLSDMAPNTSGIKSLDQLRSLQLVEWVFTLLPKFLKPKGHFVIKVFDSAEAQKFLKENSKFFDEFKFLKPESTRKISKEFFVIGKYFNP